MGQIKWYKRDPEAALEGMRKLTLEQRGAYNTVLDLIYLRDGNLPDDDRFIAGWLDVDVRVWKRLRDGLIAVGKLRIEDGMIRNDRAVMVVDEALRRVASSRNAGQQSGRARNQKSEADGSKNSDLGRTTVGTGVPTGVSTTKNKRTTLETNVSNGADAPKAKTPTVDDLVEGAPAQPQAFDIVKAIFDAGVSVLAGAGQSPTQARSIVGRYRKQFGDSIVLTALSRCQREQPSNPIEWLPKALQHEAGRAAGNGNGNSNSPRSRNGAVAELERRVAAQQAERSPGEDYGSAVGGDGPDRDQAPSLFAAGNGQ